MKLHLGCGQKLLPGFVNLDILPGADLQDDIRKLEKVEENSCDLIYACHVLEHVSRHDVTDVLKLWHTRLRPGGTLRLAVPDFGAAVKWYTEHKAIPDILGLVSGGQRDQYDYHGCVFDKAYLTQLLTDAGFQEVREWEWRETEHAGVDDYSQAYLPHMDKERGLLVSLNLEATK